MLGLRKSQHLKIPLKEIEIATQNFKTCIGRGGYGLVYKGELFISGTSTTVAVKRLNEQYGQGLKEFLTEIRLLSGKKHPNLISLLGFCDEGKEKIIVYEYAARGSLDKYLRSSGTTYSLTWLERLGICVDAARGLDHLHNHIGKDKTIIHRDIKSANILIDNNWVAKISDLGLSKLSFTGADGTSVITRACGTPGYCEPEYVISGIVQKESDIYSFGMVLFEVLCGRLCSVKHHDGLLLSAQLAKDYYQKEKLIDLIDPHLWEQMCTESMKKFSAVAFGCVQNDRGRRPSMDLVVLELVESMEIQVEYETAKLKSSELLEYDSNEFQETKLPEEYDSDEYWEKKLPEDAQDIIKSLSPGVIYNSKKELFSLLHVGLLFDDNKRVFSINKDGKKCELISALSFLEHGLDLYEWTSEIQINRICNLASFFYNKRTDIRCQIRTSMLSYNTMYAADLVFRYFEKHEVDHREYVMIKWKMGEVGVFSTHLAKGTKDRWLKLRLWFFINYKKYADFEMIIENISKLTSWDYWEFTLQGIEFEPIKTKAEHNLESLSKLNEDIDWEDKFPSDYEDLIQRSDKKLEYKTKKELYFLLCEGILIDNGKLWFSLCKLTGKKCHMIQARKIMTKHFGYRYLDWIPLPESRFGEGARIQNVTSVLLVCELTSDMFSHCNFYSAYLVLMFLKDHPDNHVWEAEGCLDRKPYPCIPIIKPNKHDPDIKEFSMLNEKKRTEAVEREDGWMEVKLCESVYALEDHNSLEMTLRSTNTQLGGIIVQGIEFRPLQLGI